MKKFLLFILRVLWTVGFLGAIVAAFFGFPYCRMSVKVQGLAWGLGLTLLFGRFFCRTMCPLGVLQSVVNLIFHPRTHVRRVCTRLPETKNQRIVRWTIFFLCVALGATGLMGLALMIVPISIFGKAITLWWPGVIVFALVMALAAIGDGRIWCNWVCPFGTLFNLISKISIFKNKVGAGCGNCRKCFAAQVMKAGDQPASGITRRETLKCAAALAVTEKLADGGFAEVSLPGVPDRGHSLLPPGVPDRERFAVKCAACQLCVANCPGHCLKPSTKLSEFGQPIMDFTRGYCILNCARCTEVCPEGALQFLLREQRPNVHMGYAEWKQDLCVRTTNGDQCTACVRKCPLRAIHLVQGFPVVDRDKCIGCGACEHVCPARPLPAIFVRGYEMQRIVNPISEADLVAEMKARIEAGAAIVVAKGGVIIAEESGRGLAPLLKLFDAGRLYDTVVMDKVVGRASAAICAKGGVKKVYTMLAGEGADKILAKSGAELKAVKTVKMILNREQTDSCPMEQAVAGMDDPTQMIEAIRKVKIK